MSVTNKSYYFPRLENVYNRLRLNPIKLALAKKILVYVHPYVLTVCRSLVIVFIAHRWYFLKKICMNFDVVETNKEKTRFQFNNVNLIFFTRHSCMYSIIHLFHVILKWNITIRFFSFQGRFNVINIFMHLIES